MIRAVEDSVLIFSRVNATPFKEAGVPEASSENPGGVPGFRFIRQVMRLSEDVPQTGREISGITTDLLGVAQCQNTGRKECWNIEGYWSDREMEK